MYAEFDLLTPASVGKALDKLEKIENEDDCMPLAGGTNLIVDLRARNVAPDVLLSVGRLSGLRDIEIEDGRVSMGGSVTVSEILRHPERSRFGPALVGAANVFGGQMVRNTATIGGNICCGSPAADLVPPLLALDAVVTLECRDGSRGVPLAEYFTGYKSSVRKPNELLTRISWPEPPAGTTSLFYKLARRKGDAVTVVGVAISLAMENGICTRARIALGAVAPIVIRVRSVEEMLEGNALDPELIEAAARGAAKQSSPIDDVRASGKYRKQQVFVLVRRLVSQAWQSLSEGDRNP